MAEGFEGVPSDAGVWAATLAAQIQADAAVEAAKIQAAAAIDAAWATGWFTFSAGGLAILGAVIGAIAVHSSASRQRRLDEERHANRTRALRFRIRKAVEDLEGSAQLKLFMLGFELKQAGPTTIKPAAFVVPKILDSQFWEDHAILGVEVVECLHEIHWTLEQIRELDGEAAGGKLMAHYVAMSADIVGTTQDEEGEDQPKFETAGDQQKRLYRELVKATVALETLVADNEIIDWRERMREAREKYGRPAIEALARMSGLPF